MTEQIHRFRRVVTTNRADGAATFARDEAPPRFITRAALPGHEFSLVWGTDGEAVVPFDGRDPTVDGMSLSPGPGGTRFIVNRWPPGSEFQMEHHLKSVSALREGDPSPGSDNVEDDEPGMHTTDSVDYAIVVSGEMWLELDNEEEVRLRAGDCVVQNGTRHAWRNRGSEPCVMAFVMVGARSEQG